MKTVNKKEFLELMKLYPNGGIVFSDIRFPGLTMGDLMVTNGDFGATLVVPCQGEVYDFDWNIAEYKDDDYFIILDNNDILQIIQTLTKGIRIEMIDW